MAVSEKMNLIASGSKDGDLKLWLDDDRGASDGHTILSEEIGEYRLATLGESRVALFPQGKPATIKDLKGGLETPLQGMGSSAEVLGFISTNIVCHWNGSNAINLGEIRGEVVTTKASIPLLSTNRPTGFLAGRRGFFAWTESAASNSIFVFNLSSGGASRELRGEMPGARPIRFSDNGKRLLAWKPDSPLSQAFAWDVDSGQIIFSGQSRLPRAAFADHGRVLVFAIENGNDHVVAVYDLDNPGREPTLIREKHTLLRIVVSKDQNLVAYATDGGQVRILSARGEILGEFHGYLNAVAGLAFSDDGRRLLSSFNGRESVKVWDISTRQELLNFSGEGPGLYDARWSADGDAIIVGPQYQAWLAPSWEQIAADEARK